MKLTFLFFLLTNNALAENPFELIGEKIFNDVRFSKAFMQESSGDVNAQINSLKNQHQLRSCASCHFIDEQFESRGMRGYNDFSQRSAIPFQFNNEFVTLRNTPALIGLGSKYATNDFSHHDGELVHRDTFMGNFAGPNMGWVTQEESIIAFKNLVKVIREDNPKGEPSYADLFLGVDPAIDEEMRVPSHKSVDIHTLTDQQIIDLIVDTGMVYMMNIDFQTDDNGNYIGSPYNQFLMANGIDSVPRENETNIEYTIRLRKSLNELVSPTFIEEKFFPTHKRSFKFTQSEFEGLKIFMNLPNNSNSRSMCISCHTAPLFTDSFFHNVGVSQKEYEDTHGPGSFNYLKIPSLDKRKNNRQFLSFPSSKDHLRVDLGVWNFYAAKDKAKLTNFIDQSLGCTEQPCDQDEVLSAMIARFKTPTLRNLGMSDPYFHNGSAKTLKQVVQHYKEFSERSFKNKAPQMRRMKLTDKAVNHLTDFLHSLNEDYD